MKALILAFAALGMAIGTAPAGTWQPQTVPMTNAVAAVGPLYLRCFIRVPDSLTSRAVGDLLSDSALFSFADFPGPFMVLLNGKEIARGESLPAEPRRRWKIPKGILGKKLFNVLAIRLEGDAAQSGLRVVPVLHGYHDELVLEGNWEIHPGEPAAADLQAVTNAPSAVTSFTEKNFREASTTLASNAELLRGERLPPADSLARMRPATNLAIDLILSEPAVAQPTHFSFDARGRLWVAQYRQYPYPAGLKMVSRDKYYRAIFDRVPAAPPNHDHGRDIISVHEDTNGDGTFDRHREVLTGLNMANAVLTGHGGIWVMHTPYLLFYPDANGDDVPDGPPEVRLAGFGLEDTHSIANGLAWGPDGWIYGAQGSTTTSHIRRPGVDPPDAPGIYYESCMVWRYHPGSRAYEIFAEGGGNNFGLEFDSEGRLYSGHNGGETRGWHYVQGGIYLKQSKDPGKFGPPANPFSFGELPMIKSSNKITRFSHHFAIAEGTAVPAEYRGRLFNADPLHHAVVVSARVRNGSTFTTADTGFAVESDDRAFRPVFVGNAPDGAMYVADFYEEYIAHGQNYQGQIDPDSGRIYRLRGKESRLETDLNLEAKTTSALLATLSHPNKWHRQTAVRLLGERRDPASRQPLQAILLPDTLVAGAATRSPQAEKIRAEAENSVEPNRAHPALEALWALYQAGWLNDATALAALDHPAAAVRAWAIRLLGDRRVLPDEFGARVARLAAEDADEEVRCQIASTARRLPLQQSLNLVAGLMRRDQDTADPFIPLLCWWVIERFCDSDRAAVLEMFAANTPSRAPLAQEKTTKADTIPAVPALGTSPGVSAALWKSTLAREHILPRLIRRFAVKGTRADLLACAQLLNGAATSDDRKLLASSFEDAFKGRALPALPEELMLALAQAGETSIVLRIRRGDREAVGQAVDRITETNAPRAERLSLVRAFGEVRQPMVVPALLQIAQKDGDIELRKSALTALMLYDDRGIGTDIARAYPGLPAALRLTAQSVLASRPGWSMVLLKLIQEGTVPTNSISPEAITRLRQHGETSVAELTAKIFPANQVKARPETRTEVARIEGVLKAGAGNPYQGETLFTERCATCHQLFHKGGRIGPNLTPYQRDDLGTMLPSIVEPSAEIREGYVNYLVETKDGRTLSGFIADQEGDVIVLRGFDGEDVVLARSKIAALNPSTTSLMPDGLLVDMSEQQLRDLFAYLRIPQPISR